MLKQSLIKGADYAYREKRRPGEPVQRVRLLEHIRGNKWRAEWIDPNPGLTDYVESGQLIVPWEEHRAFLRDEAAETAIRVHNTKVGFTKGSPVDDALLTVFEAVGDDVRYWRGVLTGPPEAIERIKARAGLEPTAHALSAYRDRFGSQHLPFDEAVELAHKFCACDSAGILSQIDTTERKWSQESHLPGAEYLVELLNDLRSGCALIRPLAEREERIKTLERLVWDAIYALQKAGLDSEAARLRRVLSPK